MDPGPSLWGGLFSAAGAGGTIVGFFLLNKWMDGRKRSSSNGTSVATATATADGIHRVELKLVELYGATKNNGDILRDIRDELRARRPSG